MNRPPLREITLGDLVDEVAERFPDNDAVVYVDRDYRLTYAQFKDLTDRLAKGLMALGVGHGEKVGVWATNVPYWVALQFATAKIGAVLLTVNTSYKREELRYLLQNSEAENLFVIDGFRDTDYVQTLYELVPELKTQSRGYLKSAEFPHLKRALFLGQEKHRGFYSLPEVLAMAAMVTDEEFAARKALLSPHDVVNMQYTSGTTGFPKGVMLTHYNIGNNGYWIGENQAFTEKDRVCLPVPLFHCFGCVLGVLAAVSHGACMVFLEVFKPLDVMAAIDQEKCTAVYGVPTMFIAILDHKLLRPLRLFVVAHRHHGRLALPGAHHAPGHGQDEHDRDHHLLRPDRGLAGHDPDPGGRRHRAQDRDRGPGHARDRGPGGRPGHQRARFPGRAGRGLLPRLQRHEGLLQQPRGHGLGHRRRRLAALGRPRGHGRERLPGHHRAPEGHDHPRWRERLSARDRGSSSTIWTAWPTSRWSACPAANTARRSGPSSN